MKIVLLVRLPDIRADPRRSSGLKLVFIKTVQQDNHNRMQKLAILACLCLYVALAHGHAKMATPTPRDPPTESQVKTVLNRMEIIRIAMIGFLFRSPPIHPDRSLQYLTGCSPLLSLQILQYFDSRMPIVDPPLLPSLLPPPMLLLEDPSPSSLKPTPTE